MVANVLTPLCGATHRLEVGSGSGPVHTWNNNKNTTMQFFSGALSFPRRAGQPKLRCLAEDWTVCGPCDPVRRVCTRRGLGRAQTAIKRHTRLSRDRFERVENPCKVGSLLCLEGPAFAHQGGEGRRVVRRVGGQFGPWE